MLGKNSVFGNVKGRRIWEDVARVKDVNHFGCPESENLYFGKVLREVRDYSSHRTKKKWAILSLTLLLPITWGIVM